VSLAILCPGQGGQHPAMFDVVAGHPEAETVLAMLSVATRNAVDEDIYRNSIAQPLVCAAILSRWRMIEPELPRPGLVLGYSVGEMAAHAIAGTFSIEACLRLATRRAALMDEASPRDAGLVAVLGMNESQVRALCDDSGAQIAIENAATHYVLGGPSAALDAAAKRARSNGARTVRLKVGSPAHTSWLRTASAAFERELRSVAIAAPRMAILAGIDGHLVRDAADVNASLAAQISHAVNWRRCIAHAVEMGISAFLELGPGNALSRIVHESYPKVQARSLDDFRTLSGAISAIRRTLQ
jgi:[acyl-carrier-protein] S-malonyltransferase